MKDSIDVEYGKLEELFGQKEAAHVPLRENNLSVDSSKDKSLKRSSQNAEVSY